MNRKLKEMNTTQNRVNVNKMVYNGDVCNDSQKYNNTRK